ncbi:hypothetical protein BDV93DRAFT_523721 [Ceratobasidium sp. AG-I]|nr:hypothetical protein BDV93DRAFT_523721 [Ceratobasidium sp. AG-I]
MGDTRARALAAQSHPSFARHFQHYDDLTLTDNYAPSTFDGNAVHHTPIGQPAMTFPQSAATTHHVSHELQHTFLNNSLAPSGTMVMPSSSEHIDPMTMRTFMHSSPPSQSHTTTSKRAREDSSSQPDSAKRTRVSLDGLRPTASGLVYPDDAWEMSDFSMASQHNRVLSRPTSDLSGVNSLFHTNNRDTSNHHPGPVVQRFLDSPASDRPQSADSQPRSPEIHTLNGIAHGSMHHSGPGPSLRHFASPQRRFSSASSPTFVPAIPDHPNSSSPTILGRPTPDGVNPYYTPPSSGLRPSTGTNSASSFASSSTLSAPSGVDGLVAASSDDSASNVSHSLGETEVIANFPQFYERARALCLKFNNDATTLLRSTPQNVLAQSFQMGTGVDPMRMLNDAKAICERMMLADPTSRTRVPSSTHIENAMLSGLPHAYSTSGYPPPFHGPWSPRPPSSSHPDTPSGVDEVADYFPHVQIPKGAYGPDPTIQRELSHSRPSPSIDVPFNNSTLRSAANVNHGTWRDEESEKLKQLAEHSRATSKATGQDKIDWDWVVERFGASRTRHQILIKATHLGLKPTSTHPSRIRKRLAKAEAQAAAAVSTTPSSSDSSGPLTAHPGSLTQQDSPIDGPRHYPPHVLNQTVDGRSKSGESPQAAAGNSTNTLTYEPGSSA